MLVHSQSFEAEQIPYATTRTSPPRRVTGAAAPTAPPAAATCRSIMSSSSVAGSHVERCKLPNIYVLPLQSEFADDLLSCTFSPRWRCRERKGKPPFCTFSRSFLPFPLGWPAREGRDDHGFFAAHTSPRQPFGQTTQGTSVLRSSLGLTADLDVHLSRMVQGYAFRVSDPADADLFYLPALWAFRLGCHPLASNRSSWAHLQRRFSDEVAALLEWALAGRPAVAAPVPVLTAAGMPCSCHHEAAQRGGCNPVAARPALRQRLLVAALEPPPRGVTAEPPLVERAVCSV